MPGGHHGGGNLEECRAMLLDATQEMTRAYLEAGQVLPQQP